MQVVSFDTVISNSWCCPFLWLFGIDLEKDGQFENSFLSSPYNQQHFCRVFFPQDMDAAADALLAGNLTPPSDWCPRGDKLLGDSWISQIQFPLPFFDRAIHSSGSLFLKTDGFSWMTLSGLLIGKGKVLSFDEKWQLGPISTSKLKLSFFGFESVKWGKPNPWRMKNLTLYLTEEICSTMGSC